MMLSVYPVAALGMIALAVLGEVVRSAGCARRRRAALAARADYEHRALIHGYLNALSPPEGSRAASPRSRSS